MGACGCNNKGTVSMTSQLPPGCDSILSIDTNDVGTETIITITFCSGAIQQFSIPHGEDGSNGSSGGDGSSGADGNGIDDITAEQNGTEVTLTVTLNNGEIITLTFNIPTAAGAYIVQHHSQGNSAPELSNEFATVLLNDLTGNFSVIKGTVPGNTIVNAGDTLHWDAVFNVTAASLNDVHDVFKTLYLCVGDTDTIDDRVVNLAGNPSNISLRPSGPASQSLGIASMSIHVNIEMSKTNSPNRDSVMLKGTMEVYDKGEQANQSHSINDYDAPGQSMGTVGFYRIAPFTPDQENYIQLMGIANTIQKSEGAINLDRIYMTVTKIPKI